MGEGASFDTEVARKGQLVDCPNLRSGENTKERRRRNRKQDGEDPGRNGDALMGLRQGRSSRAKRRTGKAGEPSRRNPRRENRTPVSTFTRYTHGARRLTLVFTALRCGASRALWLRSFLKEQSDAAASVAVADSSVFLAVSSGPVLIRAIPLQLEHSSPGNGSATGSLRYLVTHY